LRFKRGQATEKRLLVDGVREFRSIEGRNDNAQAQSMALVDSSRARIGDVARHQETRIDVSVQ
jgi:hypothetical protein